MKVAVKIAVRAKGTVLPGMLVHVPAGGCPDNTTWIDADGRYLSMFEFSELYAVIGDKYSQKLLCKEIAPSRWERFRRFFGGTPVKEFEWFENPDHRPGYFRIPSVSFGVYAKSREDA